MEREEYFKRLSNEGSDLWRSCREAQNGLDDSIVTTCIGNITENLSKYHEFCNLYTIKSDTLHLALR